jgi:uncharacterized protein with WD repeat
LGVCGTLLYVGNVKGEILIFNKNDSMKMMGKLKGNFGSTRDVDLSEDGKYICTASIDRFIR